MFEKAGPSLKTWFGAVAGGVALVMIGSQVSAGIVITGRNIQTGNGAAPARVQVVMIQGHRERIESGSHITLVDADRGTIVALNAATKTYTESAMKPAANVAAVRHASKPRFQPTGAKRTIAGYDCRVFKASSATPRGDQTVIGCFSSAVPGWREYRDLNAMLARRTGGGAPAELPPGLPLSIVTSLKVRYKLSPKIEPAHRIEMERRVASRPPIVSEDLVTGIKTAALRPSLFAVPAGYKKLRVAGPIEH